MSKVSAEMKLKIKTSANARPRVIWLSVAFSVLICCAPAFGQAATAPSEPAKKSDAIRPQVAQGKPTSPIAMINLVNLLVKQGILKEEQAKELIKQAEDEAYVAREAAKDAGAKADDAAKAATAAAKATEPPGTRHVTYVPEVVKRQLREEIKQEVMAKAEQENWASPGKYPEWAQRIHVSGDVRMRYEGDLFPKGNGPIENFNAINTGSPFLESSAGIINPYFPPTYDTTQNRQQFLLRARLGVDVDLLNGFTAGMRIGAGNNNAPISTNQSFSSDYSAYQLWLDRGFLKYQAWGDDVEFSVGRFDNPFWSPTDLVWYREIGFDGFAVQAKREIQPGLTPFGTIGAFPIYNTDFNAGVNLDTTGTGVPTKFKSEDKYLFGGQGGIAAKLANDSGVRFAVAYYDFTNVQAQISSQCLVISATDSCDTDNLRPSFAQKGNSYTQLRNIPDFIGSTASSQYQYYGLASQFRPVVASGQIDLGHFHPDHIVFDGEYVWNTAFNRDAVAALAINNLGPAGFNGGGMGYLGRITIGKPEIRHLWDWNVHGGYKYLQSDATIDAFVDSEFGLGGTNLKGYFFGANLGLGDNVWATMRWMSANNIAGLPYAVDILQLDLNARF
jgi:hypothetical protein